MARLSTGLRSIAHKENPPLFLAPILAYTSKAANQQSHFSTTAQCYGGRKRDGNRYRGVSALRRTGLRYPVSMSKEPLPQPVLDPRKRSKITIDKNHGLWGFFNQDRTSLSTPLQDDAFGRPWAVEELRHKSWEDLHSLWWVCAKERNRLATENHERDRLKAGYGSSENQKRDLAVRRTQRAIKHVLTERWYTWEDARRVAVAKGMNLTKPAMDTRDASDILEKDIPPKNKQILKAAAAVA